MTYVLVKITAKPVRRGLAYPVQSNSGSNYVCS
jgi:hypothetical protein